MCNDIDGCNISMDQYFTLFALAEWALMQSFHHLDHYWDHEIVPEMDFQGTEMGWKIGSKTHLLHLQHW